MKIKGCIMGGCCEYPPECAHCGHNQTELNRRKKLPLIECADGLRRKYVGLPEEEENEQEAQ